MSAGEAVSRAVFTQAVGDSRLQDRSSSRKNTEQPKFAGKDRGIKVYAGNIGYKN